LEAGEIEFDVPFLNQTYDRDIFDFRALAGANLSLRTTGDILFKMLIKKVSNYKTDSWKRRDKINDFRSKKNKLAKEVYLQKFKFSIFEFLYYMRIRCNYRNLSFIDNVSSTETAKYFNAYYGFTVNFLKALDGLKEQILKMRIAGNEYGTGVVTPVP
jgi:hypothetical protein